MKTFLLILVSMMFLLSSCSQHCVWVSTGYHYDDDDNYVEDGYYDCYEDSPVSPPIEGPVLNISFKSTTRETSSKTIFQGEAIISNSGISSATDVKCYIKVKRYNFKGIDTYDYFSFSTTYHSIGSGSEVLCPFSISGETVIGCCAYSGTVCVSYLDNTGKSCSASTYIEF